jgi:sugar-specific transcriptional regulator TrmB
VTENNTYIQTLMGLGLTFLQSKIYLALASTEKAEAKTISKVSDVARPDVYRVMPALEELGLVEKIVTTPTKYRAIPIREGYTILLESKAKEQSELRDKIANLFKNTEEPKETTSEEEQFVLISSKMLFQKKCLIEDTNAQKKVNVIGDDVMRSWFFMNQHVFENALNRDVEFRIITEKKDYQQLPKIKSMFNNNPSFNIRFVEHIPIRTAIYDEKKAWMCVEPPEKNTFTPILLSNNPQFVKVLTACFENTWSQAQEPEKTGKKIKTNPIVA